MAMVAWMLWGAMVLSGSGQAVPDWRRQSDDPKPPGSGIRDAGGFFSRSPDAMARISEKLRKLEADHGFRILLLVEPVLIGTTAPDLAEQLRESWLPQGGGLVVVFESDTRNLGFGRDPVESPAGGDPIREIPAHETVTILQRVRESTDPKLDSTAYIESLMGKLAAEFDSYFKRRATPPPAGRSLRIGLLTIGALTLLALAAIVVGSLTRLPSVAGPRTWRFPVVDRPERLGAPCGGGNVTTRRFREPPPSRRGG
jgi:hypothetical protein